MLSTTDIAFSRICKYLNGNLLSYRFQRGLGVGGKLVIQVGGLAAGAPDLVVVRPVHGSGGDGCLNRKTK